MIGHELAVQQREAPDPQPRDQRRQRHLRRVAGPAEHRFAEEGAAEPQAVQPADQRAVQPAFDAVCPSLRVEREKRLLDLLVDPRLAPVGGVGRTMRDHLGEGSVGAHFEPVLPDRLGKAFRQVKSVERQHRPPLRLDPESVGIVARVRHREDADGIGIQKKVEVDRHAG